MDIKTKSGNIDGRNIRKCKGSHISKSCSGIIRLETLHRDLIHWKVKPICHALWKVFEYLRNRQLIAHDKLVVQLIKETNLDHSSIGRLRWYLAIWRYDDLGE